MDAWLASIRLKTLSASVVPIIAASALAYSQGYHIKAIIFICILISACSIQIATNFFNDLLDVKKGADGSARLGPLRGLHTGEISAALLGRAAIMSIVVAVLSGIPLVIEGGLTILVIGLASLLLAYLYTGGPLPLAYNALGDLFVILFFGIIATAGTYFLHTGAIDRASLVLGIQIGCLATAMIAINNLRDSLQDKAAGKRTLAVVVGLKGTRMELGLLFLLPYLLHLYWMQYSFLAFFLPLLTAPFALSILFFLLREPPSAKYNLALVHTALVHTAFGTLYAVGLFLG